MQEPTKPADVPNSPVPIARAYDRWAAVYDVDRNATRDLDAKVLRANLDVSGSDVLELGCGTGKNTVWLAEHARSVLALDFSLGMLARARERISAPNVRFEHSDVRSPWPAQEESIDVVVGNLILEHVGDLSPIYAEAARVLRRGGRLWICELHPERQRRGAQAHFTDESGNTVHVDAFQHTVSEYVNGGIASGLRLQHLGEWLEAGADASAVPRLLSVHFLKPDDA